MPRKKLIDLALQGGGAHGAFLGHLHDSGRRIAREWLDVNCDNLGKRSTVNLEDEFLHL